MKRWHPFEGIIPNFERRYRETDSIAVRDDLARYQAARPCPQCDGTRLRREARHVRLAAAGDANPAAGRAIYEIEHATLAEALAYFESLQLAGAKAEIADKVVREIRARLGFLNDVRPAVPEPGPRRRHVVGRRGAAHPAGEPDRRGLTGVMYVLDEPSIGLHQRDNERLIAHAAQAARPRQHRARRRARRGRSSAPPTTCVDIGPGAGVHGGQVIAQGTPEQIGRATRSR